MGFQSESEGVSGGPRTFPEERRAALRSDAVAVEARFLFLALLRLTQPDVVLDIGSYDGRHAKQIRRAAPAARVIAFEANEQNYCDMVADRELHGIEVRRQAVSDVNGMVTFYELERSHAEYWSRAASSLRRRGPEIATGLAETPRTVESVRVDSVIGSERAALWVDVEGALDLVIAGMAGASGAYILHAEVETVPLWEGEASESTILAQLRDHGLVEVWRDPEFQTQDNVLFCRGIAPWKVAMAMAAAHGYEATRRIRRALSLLGPAGRAPAG